MNRIPTEGLKQIIEQHLSPPHASLNEQNPDRGIETIEYVRPEQGEGGLNEQNPDRGIETGGCSNRARTARTLE